MALYRAPTEWVGLTDKEIQDLGYLSEKFDASNSEWFDRWGFARAIEQSLREKNHG
jgi:N-acetylglutamate synthase-like GNAT family acetyltransferase